MLKLKPTLTRYTCRIKVIIVILRDKLAGSLVLWVSRIYNDRFSEAKTVGSIQAAVFFNNYVTEKRLTDMTFPIHLLYGGNE